jgi:isopropylmalate/homocitrate/citramalate synthase
MELLDTTLREGEQCYGVFFSLETKIRIARLLDDIGVDFIEVGHPAAAPSLREAVSQIARLDLRAQRIGHARLDRDEIRLVRDLGLRWVGLFSGINASSLERYGLSHAAAFERISRSVRYAKEIGLSVRFTCEDASRTGTAELSELYGKLQELGVERMSYADTVGFDAPERLEQRCRELGKSVDFGNLHFHFHDDRGLAFANAVKAVELGARCIDASILGLGERVGLVPLEGMVRWRERTNVCSGRNDTRRDEALNTASEIVASSVDPIRFDQRRFAHKSGIHIHGVLRDPLNYEQADPAVAGGRRLIVLSKLIGRSGLRMLLSRHGFTASDAGLDRMLRRIKAEDSLELTDPLEIARYFAACSECLRMAYVAAT